MRFTSAAISTALVLSLASAAHAAESWYVFKSGADGWMFNESGLAKDSATGFMRIQVGRLHGTPQVEGGVTWSYEIRRYEVDCASGRCGRGATERYTTEGRPLAPLPPDAGAPWVPSSFGWPLKAKTFACDASPEQGGTKAPSKISAMAMMQTLVGATGASTTVPAQASTTDFCKTIRTVLGEGRMQTPYFNAFYLNAAEKTKYAGLGSTPISGFGTCRIQQAMIQPHKGYATFASYYCEKTGGSETENATFAASIGKQVEACLPNSYFVEGNDGGQSIKTREYALSISGYPRVRVRHDKDGVTIHLDAK
jgi:hypothetical protein